MNFTDELQPESASGLADLRDIPLAKMPGLGLTMLETAMDRILDTSVERRPVGAFQSSI